MTRFLACSIYSYIASFASWRIEKKNKEHNNEQKIKIFFELKHGFRVKGTVLLIAHFLII